MISCFVDKSFVTSKLMVSERSYIMISDHIRQNALRQ